jgi:hypothetical protein
MLDSAEPQLEAWKGQLLKKFSEAALIHVMGLEASDGLPLSTLAWTARNLLEISIWAEYCNQSPSNARRFFEDVLRDLFDLVKLGNELAAKQPDSQAEFDGMSNRLRRLAITLNIPTAEESFTKVQQAAKAIGRGDDFVLWNKVFSKFAHPTALVMFMDFPPNVEKQLRDMIVSEAIQLAQNIFPHLKELVTKEGNKFEVSETDRLAAVEILAQALPAKLRERFHSLHQPVRV